nr:MAG TPA: helix-turn-helix domain protein [Caudoviricetes sp.]
MPYKHEAKHIKLVGLQDRRRKLTDEQYIEIREKREQGKSLMTLAKEYNVSKKTILLIVNPESKAKQEKYIKDHWREFRQSQEYCTRATRETRRYKQGLMTSGKLTKSQQ